MYLWRVVFFSGETGAVLGVRIGCNLKVKQQDEGPMKHYSLIISLEQH